jgi:hypothetical protein
MRTNAINWCMLAKSYQQDRNYIGVQLSELEVKLAQAQKRPGSTSDDVTATSSTSPAPTTNVDRTEADSNTEDFVSQSISQLLDTM